MAAFASSMVSATESISACTMQYAPVCGSVQVQCITAPCNPVRQTFGNSCVAWLSHATNVTQGACEDQTPPGWDTDKYGCKPSTGYTWNSRARQCLRSWESRVRVVTIAPQTVACTGVGPMNCLQAKFIWPKEWGNLYFGIKGFDFVSGYTYRLLVLENRIANPVADGSSIEYSLIKILSKRLTTIITDAGILGNWNLIGFNGSNLSTLKPDLTPINLNLTADRFSIKICNSMNGSYSLVGNTFSNSMMMSTKMACFDTAINTMENAWNLDGATYSLVGIRRMAGSIGSTMQMTITTKKGDTFTFGN